MQSTALVTGASAGIGAEFARQLAAAGNGLLLVARRAERLEELAASLRSAHGVEVTTFAADLSDPAGPAAIEAFASERGLQIDTLVNNAGSAGPHLLDDRDWGAQVAFFELMIISVAQMCHRFVPPMRERGHGRVLNVASFAGRVARPAGANYGPSKAWVVALSEELALELRGSGVRVCALCPGFTHTEFHESAGLTEMKQSLPGILWYDAPTVVREGLAALDRGRALQMSGRLYRWLDPLAQSVWTRPIFKRLTPGR